MTYIFFGNSDFSVIVFQKLLSAGFIPAAVVCGPDKPTGRKQIITPPPVKGSIKRHASSDKERKIKVFQPEDLSMIRDSLFAIHPDLFIVAAYPKIISREILDIPRLGTLGVHPSLLPKYRGASPIQTAIMEGDKETGATIYLMDEKIDHGPVIASNKHQVSSETCEELSKKLWEIGGGLLVEILPKFLIGKINPQIQDESQATFTKKFKTEDAYIEPLDLEKARNERGETAEMIDRKIRAFNPEPGAWTMEGGKRLKLLEAEMRDGKLKLVKIQKEGKNPINIERERSGYGRRKFL